MTTLKERLKSTLGDLNWLRIHEDDIKKLLPENWTHMENLNALKLAFHFKLLGIDWRSTEEFGSIMLYLEKIGFLLRQNRYQVRANPSRVLS